MDKEIAAVLSCIPGAVFKKNRPLEFIREESGVYMINNKTGDFLRDIKKPQRSSKNVDKEKRAVCD